MCILPSMVYELFKLTKLWFNETWIKETVLLLNMHSRCFVDFILCPTDMFKVKNKKIRLICIYSNLKINRAWYRSGVFIVDFDHSQDINILFLHLTLKKYLSAECELQVMMLWKQKKQYIILVIKLARPISFSNLSLHRNCIEINYDQIVSILWHEHIMDYYGHMF